MLCPGDGGVDGGSFSLLSASLDPLSPLPIDADFLEARAVGLGLFSPGGLAAVDFRRRVQVQAGWGHRWLRVAHRSKGHC